MDIDYSVVIPAYNEAAWLPKTLAALKKAMAHTTLSGEIIVTDNNSTDDTAALARDAGAKVVFEPHNQISRARNTGARQAKGRYLLFVDADTLITPQLLCAALENLQFGKCCGGGAVVQLDGNMHRTARAALGVWTWLSTRLRLAAGCFIYCLRSDFKQVGGFSESVYASEEIWFSRHLHRLGKTRNQPFCIITEYPVQSSSRKLAWFSVWKQLLLILMLTLFPFLVRYKRYCGFWYDRPEKNSKPNGP